MMREGQVGDSETREDDDKGGKRVGNKLSNMTGQDRT